MLNAICYFVFVASLLTFPVSCHNEGADPTQPPEPTGPKDSWNPKRPNKAVYQTSTEALRQNFWTDVENFDKDWQGWETPGGMRDVLVNTVQISRRARIVNMYSPKPPQLHLNPFEDDVRFHQRNVEKRVPEHFIKDMVFLATDAILARDTATTVIKDLRGARWWLKRWRSWLHRFEEVGEDGQAVFPSTEDERRILVDRYETISELWKGYKEVANGNPKKVVFECMTVIRALPLMVEWFPRFAMSEWRPSIDLDGYLRALVTRNYPNKWWQEYVENLFLEREAAGVSIRPELRQMFQDHGHTIEAGSEGGVRGALARASSFSYLFLYLVIAISNRLTQVLHQQWDFDNRFPSLAAEALDGWSNVTAWRDDEAASSLWENWETELNGLRYLQRGRSPDGMHGINEALARGLNVNIQLRERAAMLRSMSRHPLERARRLALEQQPAEEHATSYILQNTELPAPAVRDKNDGMEVEDQGPRVDEARAPGMIVEREDEGEANDQAIKNLDHEGEQEPRIFAEVIEEEDGDDYEYGDRTVKKVKFAW